MMNKKYVIDIAKEKTPEVEVIKKDDWFRHTIVSELKGNNNKGIELGVAIGIYSKRMLNSDKFNRFYGVDIYGDTHDVDEYKDALKYIGFDDPRYCLLRIDFDSALDMFEDNSFDFIYIDGFAHTGEEGGKSLVDWYKKLKVGGILAGDDYHDDWPLVKWAVNHLAHQLDVAVSITGGKEDAAYSAYPTWYIKKESSDDHIEVDTLLYELGMKEKRRIYRNRVGFHVKYRKFAGKILDIIGIKKYVLNFFHNYVG